MQQSPNGKIQVTSRGCSRAYVLCVLWRALDFVRRKWHEKIPVSFPFDDDDVLEWLLEAKNDAVDIHFQTTVGMQDFNPRDEQTFWTDTKQFFLWWKNNVERRGKFRALLRDAVRCFSETKTEPRALYCRQAIAICVNIKNHFQRIKNEQDDKGIVYQINCPLEMPETVPREAILHANRTEWREFDNYLAHIWSLKANDITSNIPICRLDITSQTLGNERSSSSSATVNSSRRRSASHHLTISMENCDIDNDSMENYVVKRRRKCKIAAPVIDDTDISDENYLANIVHTENYWANCSGPLISAETFNTMSTKAKRGRKFKGTTSITDAEAVAVSADSIADDFLKSSVGTKRSYNTNDSIIVVPSKVLQDFSPSPLFLNISHDSVDCTINSADYRNFRDLIDFRDLDACDCYGQEDAARDAVNFAGSALISHDRQSSDRVEAYAPPLECTPHDKDKKLVETSISLSQSHESQFTESERNKELSSGFGALQQGGSGGGLSSLHNSSSLTRANLSAHVIGSSDCNRVHSDSHSFSTCTSVPTTCTSPGRNSFGEGDLQVFISYHSMVHSNHMSNQNSCVNNSNCELHYNNDISSIDNNSSFGNSNSSSNNSNSSHNNGHTCSSNVHSSGHTSARCSPFPFSGQSNHMNNTNSSACVNWHLPDFQSHLLRRNDSSRLGINKMRDEDSAIDEPEEGDSNGSYFVRQEDGSVVIDEDSEHDAFKNIIYESLLSINDM